MLNSSLEIIFVEKNGRLVQLFAIDDRRRAWEQLTGRKVKRAHGTCGELGLFELVKSDGIDIHGRSKTCS